MGAASPPALPQSLDRFADLQPRRLDARYCRHVADDGADVIAPADCADADRSQPSGSASLPVLILGLPAGATADIFERRRLLIFWQSWMLGTVAILSVLTFVGVISPWTLLALTFLLNIGSAMNSPGWQAIVPELVPRAELPDAISTNSAGFNLARSCSC